MREGLVARLLPVALRCVANDGREVTSLDDPHLGQPVPAALHLLQRGSSRNDAVDPHVLLLVIHQLRSSRPPERSAFSFSGSSGCRNSSSFSAPASRAPLLLALAPD